MCDACSHILPQHPTNSLLSTEENPALPYSLTLGMETSDSKQNLSRFQLIISQASITTYVQYSDILHKWFNSKLKGFLKCFHIHYKTVYIANYYYYKNVHRKT